MANAYYNHAGYPATSSSGSSASMRAELDLITAGFNKLPALAGNGGLFITVDPTGSFLQPVSAVNGVSIGATTPSTGAFTTLTATTPAGTDSSTNAATTAWVQGQGYLTSTNAASTYLTQTTAASTYLTQTSAASTYTTSSAVNTIVASSLASPPAIGSGTANTGKFTTCTASTFNSTSTRRLKKRIRAIQPKAASAIIEALTPVAFQWKKTSPKAGQNDIGFIAEEVAKWLPEVVSTTPAGEATGLDYGKLTTVLWAEVKALRARVEALEAESDN